MKKTYLIPALKVEEAEVVNMLAESLIIDNDTTVSGDDALTAGKSGLTTKTQNNPMSF